MIPASCVRAQLRQVLLDPAVNREVGRLKAEAEAKARELKVAQEELQAVQVQLYVNMNDSIPVHEIFSKEQMFHSLLNAAMHSPKHRLYVEQQDARLEL